MKQGAAHKILLGKPSMPAGLLHANAFNRLLVHTSQSLVYFRASGLFLLIYVHHLYLYEKKLVWGTTEHRARPHALPPRRLYVLMTRHAGYADITSDTVAVSLSYAAIHITITGDHRLVIQPCIHPLLFMDQGHALWLFSHYNKAECHARCIAACKRMC